MKDDDLNYFASESLKEDSFSSHVHNQELMAQESAPFHLKDEYIIKERYGIDMVKLLPVNLNTLYIYWEITKDLLEKSMTSIDKITARLFRIDGNNEVKLFEFGIFSEVGEYYVHITAPMQKLLTKVGYYDLNGNFTVLLISNAITTPNDKIEQTRDEIWMSKDKDFKEIIQASAYISCPLSSKEMVINSRVLEELSKREQLSSATFIRKDS